MNYLPHWGTDFRNSKNFSTAESGIYRQQPHRLTSEAATGVVMYKKVFLKETRNSYFCITPKNHMLMFVSWK